MKLIDSGPAKPSDGGAAGRDDVDATDDADDADDEAGVAGELLLLAGAETCEPEEQPAATTASALTASPVRRTLMQARHSRRPDCCIDAARPR
jgi:hypothetical protein